ncbi:Glycerol-3-phosphate acyltransferase [gamma proteobacterium HdN1]|nr:Glycerol-3-phosphate acyltransferase [gamma proteobacterium HdN1]
MPIVHFFLWIVKSILFLFVRTSVKPSDIDSLNLDRQKPICFVLRDKSLSDLLVLDAVCRENDLPRPTRKLEAGAISSPRSVIYLTEKHDSLGRKQKPKQSDLLNRLVQAGSENQELDVQFVPVSIFWGRAPDNEDSLFKLLFADTWAVPGMFRKLFLILIQGRRTLVYFNEPVMLREVLNENLGEARTVKKISRILRVHFRRLREAVIGPDLSHRRTIMNNVLRRPAVLRAIDEEVASSNKSIKKVTASARAYADEIAADYSDSMIRAFATVLSWLWNKLYDGVNIHNLDRLAKVAKENEIIYVPCHRSHIDYLLLSYALYNNNLVPPHIAAGINLNLPVLGTILRGGGAFFLRRSFKGNKLYATVFNEYVSTVFERGFSMEYFIEGGRSRTGRLLHPRPGMLAMTLRSFMNSQRRPFVFVPVYFGYERIVEGGTYVNELYGKAKKKESLWDIFRTLRRIKSSFGKVHVNFGEAIPLAQLLDHAEPQWRNAEYDDETTPPWTHEFVDNLGERIMTHINNSAVVNPVNLISLALLATPKHAMDDNELASQLDLYLTLLREIPYSNSVIIPEIQGRDIIAYCERLEIIYRAKHPFGDIITLNEEKAVTLTYFRNNIIHLFVLPSLIACLITNNRHLPKQELLTLCQQVFPFMKSELFIHWDSDQLDGVISQYIKLMTKTGLLVQRGKELWTPEPRTAQYVSLSVLADTLKQTLERFYIVLEILQHIGSGKVNRQQMENLCHLMAQRMAMLHEFRTPEFSDKSLFKNFLQNLLDSNLLHLDEEGLILLDEQLSTSDWHSDRILSMEIRIAIQQVTHLEQAELEALKALTTSAS